MASNVELVAVPGLPEIGAGDRLGELLADAVRREAGGLSAGDIIVVSQKIVSKAEGRVRDLSRIEPGARARQLAERLDKDPRLLELILAESREVIRAERGVLIVETKSGLVCANAGVDASNVPGEDHVALLPENPDVSARRLRAELAGATSGLVLAVLIADSFGRPWRLGQTDVAVGCAGFTPLDDRRGQTDREGRELAATQIAIADEIASAADLARSGEDGIPACIVRGLESFVSIEDGPGAGALRRPAADDLFRRRD
jgi:coenzyme F420-0:L-glutamate ligase/coenzyme F420-1:gamma-L-glutamate ligase